MLDFFLDNWLVTLIMLWFLFGLFGQGNRQKAERQHQHPAAEKRRRELQKQQDVLRTEAERKKREITESVKRVAEQLEGRMEEARETLEIQCTRNRGNRKTTDDDSHYVREAQNRISWKRLPLMNRKWKNLIAGPIPILTAPSVKRLSTRFRPTGIR